MNTDRTDRTCLVVPCYNEAERFNATALSAIFEDERVDLILVDDGSKDATSACLRKLASRHADRVEVLALDKNHGKGEAVRLGMLAALRRRVHATGYFDADLATPVSEVLRLVRVLYAGQADAVLGSRVALLGSNIERSLGRHYLGRVFATAASMILRAHVYDTQCGAKLFRSNAALCAALLDPFISRWAFDVELLGRLLTGTPETPALPVSSIHEEPLLIWHDIGGSKLKAMQMARVLADLVQIERALTRRRQRPQSSPS